MVRKLFMLTDRSKWNDPEYAKEHYEEILVDRIDSIATGNKEDEFTSEELGKICSFCVEVDRVENARGIDRWNVCFISIFEWYGRFFAIRWIRKIDGHGKILNGFYNQPYEVTKRTKQITVTELVRKDEDEND